ncbi:threonine--tRNA ligase, partial [bacterium]|nr:threonine--tRNA ligase [bacterium]
SRRLHAAKGYLEVLTPHLVSTSLWKKSGHLDNFREHMYICPDGDDPDKGMGVRPMNCPGHMLIYKMARRSYRELPMRLQEFGTVYRNEKGGTMHGLMRVKGFTQDDAHIFCRMDQLEDEILVVLNLAKETWDTLGFKSTISLKGRPPVSLGQDADWERAETALRAAAERAGMEFDYVPDDGAFYGPKIDFEIEDAIGRLWQCGTVQVDFALPARFGLTYIDKNDREKVPVVIHRAILGSLERTMGIIIEHFAGDFPLWLTPVQAIILPISDRHKEPAKEMAAQLTAAGARVLMDGRSETIGKKIREAEIAKIPYMLVIGDREANAGTASVRHRAKGDLGTLSRAEVEALFVTEGRLP